LPLWVARMILMAGFHLGQAPFKTVMIHGLVRDSKGRKFSKSLGNGIDPLEMIDKYGADALRMGLLVGSAIGHDIRFDEQKVKGYKHFANKLWNIARFVLENTNKESWSDKQRLQSEDFPYKNEMDRVAREVSEHLEGYRTYMAAEQLYHYVWHEFADKIIEESKGILNGPDETAKTDRRWLLAYLLSTCLKLLHPFMPFVTEEIYQSLPTKDSDYLMVAPWPVVE
ncbi:MAG: class I tRNA ligase family protein, partial [Patescibacteria group bacterium]|nr:class I tRNA ligase family protein [Patescibacteria group bacterium]